MSVCEQLPVKNYESNLYQNFTRVVSLDNEKLITLPQMFIPALVAALARTLRCISCLMATSVANVLSLIQDVVRDSRVDSVVDR